MAYHTPVLLKESIEGLNIKPDGVYVDLTFGGGGHSKEILKHIKKGKLIVFDCDTDAEQNLINDSRFLFVRQNYRFFKNYLRYHNFPTVDGILADLGVSSQHFDAPERGFSYRFNATLDMRMDQTSGFSACNVINEYSQIQLADIFFKYGELSNARKIAAEIIHARENKKISTTGDLIECLKVLYKPVNEYKFLSKVFQAVRIEVNHEIDYLQQMLSQVTSSLNVGGRFVIITYHSIEDRAVKNFLKNPEKNIEYSFDLYGNTKKELKLINKKVITPSEDELKLNKRARSAKLRIAERI